MRHAMDTIPTGCEAEFVGEGAANLVFKITPPNTSTSPAFSEGMYMCGLIPRLH